MGVGMEIKDRKNPENFEIVRPVCVPPSGRYQLLNISIKCWILSTEYR